MTNFASDDDVEPADPGPYVEMGSARPGCARRRRGRDAAGLALEALPNRLDEVGPDWDARLAAVEAIVADLRGGITARGASGSPRRH